METTTTKKANPKPTKAYPCSYCKKSFNSSSQRTVHVRRHHTGEKPFVCSFKDCGKRFYSSSALSVHAKIHEEKRKKYECKYCGRQLLTKSGLDYHIKSIHLLERPHKCDIEGCNASFMTKANLENHFKKHYRQLNKEKKSCEKQIEQFRKANESLRHKITAETKRAHELELKVRKLVRKVERGPKIAGRLKPIKTSGDSLPEWVPESAVAFYIPDENCVTLPLSNISCIVRDRHGIRIQGLEQYRDNVPSKNANNKNTVAMQLHDAEQQQQQLQFQHMQFQQFHQLQQQIQQQQAHAHHNQTIPMDHLQNQATTHETPRAVAAVALSSIGANAESGQTAQQSKSSSQMPERKRKESGPRSMESSKRTKLAVEQRKVLKQLFDKDPRAAESGISFQSWRRGLSQEFLQQAFNDPSQSQIDEQIPDQNEIDQDGNEYEEQLPIAV